MGPCFMMFLAAIPSRCVEKVKLWSTEMSFCYVLEKESQTRQLLSTQQMFSESLGPGWVVYTEPKSSRILTG